MAIQLALFSFFVCLCIEIFLRLGVIQKIKDSITIQKLIFQTFTSQTLNDNEKEALILKSSIKLFLTSLSALSLFAISCMPMFCVLYVVTLYGFDLVDFLFSKSIIYSSIITPLLFLLFRFYIYDRLFSLR